ncbi:MAG TPA: TlyA family RNA methyltransferase [Clostridiales bacterium]|nr:TlyA family RNA methyltransferase [Clostridiales bacterium]
MKKRLDLTLYEQGLTSSREKAQALIMAGLVYVNGVKQTKSGFQVGEKDKLELRENPIPYVSRGGLKLKKAIDVFGLDLKDKLCLDVGASTGGFTDCMLQHGARKVYAVDVGYNQLAWELRANPKVISMEKTNFRHATGELFEEPFDFASVDVSFISLSNILPTLASVMNENAMAVCLIKPQFEAGREKVGKKGVVRDEQTHIEVIDKILTLAFDNSFNALKLDYSPIKGPQGNIEYLLLIEKTSDSPNNYVKNTEETVKTAHLSLNGGE